MELLVDALAVKSHEGRRFAVGVVLARSAAVVLQAVERLGHLEAHAEAEHVGNLGPRRGVQRLCDRDGAVLSTAYSISSVACTRAFHSRPSP